MKLSKKELKKNLVFGFVKGFFIYLLYGIFTFPATLFIRNRKVEREYVQGFWTEELYCITSFTFSLVFFFSLVSIFTLADNHFRKSFAETENTEMGFFSKCKFIFTSGVFWFETATISLLIALFPYATTFSEFYYGFFNNNELSFLQENLVIIAFMVPLFFILTFLANMSTVNWWQRLRLKRVLSKENRTVMKTVFQLSYTTVLYIIAAAALCIVVPMFYSMFSLLKFVLLGFFAAVVLVFALVFALKYGNALLSRRKMMRKLKKICGSNRYKISNESAIYKSVIFNTDGASFTLATDKQIYRCKLICCAKKKKSLYFRDKGEVFYTNDFLGIIKHTTSFSYTFDAKDRLGRETQKIIVVCPEAAKLFVTDDATDRLVYSGDSVMGYKVYQASAFLGSLDHRCF